MFPDDFNPKSTLQERVNILKGKGYRGFSLSGGSQRVEGAVQVVGKNSKGIMLTAEGDSYDEACENLIDQIDYTLDDHH
ncbi:MAG: hypothetical protein JJU13_12655 [Balneolaceae bacterium]|nr:hypothetical protein [Balneolaceae bacterium]